MLRRMSSPHAVVVAGPNGAGKSTSAPTLVRDTLGVVDYVNADVIASGLSGFDPASVAMSAGRILHDRLDALSRRRRSFAFETTLGTRALAPWLRSLQDRGYLVTVFFFWLPTPELALARVRLRVALGGHDVPEPVVRRRFRTGVCNFLRVYAPLADVWWLFDNHIPGEPALIARKGLHAPTLVRDINRYRDVQATCVEVGNER